MTLNLILMALIVVMSLRGAVLLIRDRRPFRLASLMFWILLGVEHLTWMSGVMPLAAACLVAAVWLRRREASKVREWLEQLAPFDSPTPTARPGSEGADDLGDTLFFPEQLRPGPEVVPPGAYAMWSPTEEEALFGPSETRRLIGRTYEAIAGIESYTLAALSRRIGVVDEGVDRLVMPDDLVSHPAIGPDDKVLVLSASRQKGIRFHFHESAAPEYRERVLSGFVADAEALRQAVDIAGDPIDELSGSSPAAWWEAMEQVLGQMEARGEPVEAVGKVLIG